MADGGLDLRRLRYLVALDKYGHFGRAAEACLISQPSLSTAIRQLEQTLGRPLVRRGRRYLGLTEDGKVVVERGRRILVECDAMRSHLSGGLEELSGRLRISSVPSALPIIPILTTELAKRHPRATIVVLEAAEEDVLGDFRFFETDVALIYREMISDRKLHTSRSLLKERYVLLTPVDGPLADRTSVSWTDIASVPLCLPTENMLHRQAIELYLGTKIHAPAQIEANSLMGLCSHVCAGYWSAVMPHAFLYPFGAPRGTIALPIEGPVGEKELCLGTIHVQPLPPLVREFMQIADETDLVRALRAALGHPLDRPSSIQPPVRFPVDRPIRDISP